MVLPLELSDAVLLGMSNLEFQFQVCHTGRVASSSVNGLSDDRGFVFPTSNTATAVMNTEIMTQYERLDDQHVEFIFTFIVGLVAFMNLVAVIIHSLRLVEKHLFHWVCNTEAPCTNEFYKYNMK